MLFYLLIAAFSIGLACMVNNQCTGGEAEAKSIKSEITRRQGMNFLSLISIFVVLFLPAALRLEVGNDYESYVDTIHEIYVGGYVVTEPLFNFLVKFLCQCSGGENYLLVFAFFSFLTLWIFLKVIYEQTEDFAFTFYLFMTLGIYFRTYNTMRYYLVLAITLFSFRYLLRREYGKFLLLIIASSFLHKSVLVVIPLYFLALLPWKKWFVFLLGAGSLIFFLLQDTVMRIVLELYPSYKNTVFLESESGIAGNLFTIFRCALVLLFCLMNFREAVAEKKDNLFYFKLNILALALYICGSFLPLVGRLGYYLITCHILLLPSVIRQIGRKEKRSFWRGMIILAAAIYFIMFLYTADEAGVRVLPYKSWLFYEKEFLNAETIF